MRHHSILFFSSSRTDPPSTFADPEAHYRLAPYSIGAIRYNLARMGWRTAYATFRTTSRPWKSARLLDDFAPDIVYTYGAATALMPLFCRRFLCRGARAFKVVHGWDDVYSDVWRDNYGRVAEALMQRIQRLIVCRSDAVVTLSRYLQQIGASWGKDCHFIPNGADVPDLSRLPDDAPRLEGRFKIVYTGDQAYWKQAWMACDAMKELPDDIHLYFTGRLTPCVRSRLRSNCTSLGWLPKSHQLAVMAQADAFVVTADMDCNAKLQEYLRFEKPIVAYDGRANRFFTNGRNALLTRNFAEAFRQLADNPDLGRGLAAQAAVDLPVHSWAEIAEKFDTYFRGLLV